MKLNTCLTILAFSFLLSACEGTSDSQDVRTSGVHATISVIATEDETSKVSARLRVGDTHSDTYLQLTNGDRLEATLNDSITENINIDDFPDYRGDFTSPEAGQENSIYRVAFIRPNDTDAPSSIVTMPPTLNITLTPSDTFSRSTDILTMTWNATTQNKDVPVFF